MTTTVYVDGSLPAVDAAWLNDVNLLTYNLCGDGTLAALTRADVISNLGLISAADIASTYLTQANAASIYLTQANAASTYLTQASATSTYVPLTGLSAYLLSSTAAATYAPLVNAHLTGIPTAPTAAPGDNTTQIATTAFVEAAISVAGAVGIIEGTTQATTSGTSITFGSLPSTVKRIVIMFQNVSSDGGLASTSKFDLTLGTVSGFETSGYSSFSTIPGHDVSGNPDNTTTASASTFVIANIPSIGLLASGAVKLDGSITLSRLDSSTNHWVLSGTLGTSIGVYSIGGSKALSNSITQIKISLEANNFDNGSINIQYES